MQQNKSLSKIYSRKRFKIFKVKKHKRKIFVFIVILMVTFLCVAIYKAINPIFEELCAEQALSIATKITNEQTTKVMAKYDYNDMFTIEKDESRKYTNDKCKYFNS